MRYCYDTEFLEDGKIIELISIGIVGEDGRTYYAVNADMPIDRIIADDWLLANVWPHLPLEDSGGSGLLYLNRRSARVKPKWVIANEVAEFLLEGTEFGPCADKTTMTSVPPELWAYFAAYDHVALMQLWGRMIDRPSGLPMYTHDLRHEMERLGIGSDLVPKPVNAHNALADAQWNMEMLRLVSRTDRGEA